MRKCWFTEEQIALRQAEAGTPAAELCRKRARELRVVVTAGGVTRRDVELLRK